MSFIKLPQYFWQLSSARFNLIYALFVMAAYNIPFINAVYEKDHSFVATALIVICIFLVLNIALSARWSSRWQSSFACLTLPPFIS